MLLLVCFYRWFLMLSNRCIYDTALLCHSFLAMSSVVLVYLHIILIIVSNCLEMIA